MDFDLIYNRIRTALPDINIRRDADMRPHCSFRVGGKARIFVEAESEKQLAALMALLGELGVEPLVLGRGSNLLVRDGGIEGVVIHMGEGFARIDVEGDRIYAEAGASLAAIASAALQHGLTGMEFAHGIPGSLGGALLMNAGAYGGEMKDIVESVRYMDAEGNVGEKEAARCGFGYRRSCFEEENCLILGAKLRLAPGDREAIAARMRELSEKRIASQPLDKPSAGSTFKRPATGYAAAMIDECGLKGFTVGGAQVSEKHAGFVINAGGATSADILELMEQVRQRVYERFGVMLEPEVKVVGEES